MSKRKQSDTKPVIYAADLFCGAGGTSTGLLDAAAELGYEVDLSAVNHSEIAILTHTNNHPGVRHRCESVELVDPRELVPGGHLHLLVASPECIHHSNARGGKPMNDQSRATAWHILIWAQRLKVDNILIENVPEFRSWGPLDDKGRPVASKRGAIYRQFLGALRAMGYVVSERVVNAADYGDATTRRRLFIQARLHKRPSWPNPTHFPTDTLFEEAKRWRPAREIIDWDLKGQSVYQRKRPLAPATMARIYAGLRKYSGLPFIVPQFSEGSPRSVETPLGSITTTSRGVGMAEPFVVNMKGQSIGRDVDEPIPTQTTESHLYLAEPSLTPFLVPNYQEREGQAPRTHDIDKPVPTIAAQGWHGLIEPAVEPFILPHQHGSSSPENVRSVDEPLSTVTAQSADMFVAEPFLVKSYTGSDAASIDNPVPAITAAVEHLGIAQPFLVVLRRNADGRTIEDPVPALAANGQHIGLATPFLVVNRTHADAAPVEDPLRTLTTGGNMALADPFIVPVTHAGSDARGHSIEEPVPTITTARRGELAVIDPYLVTMRGNDGYPRGASAEEPVPTITTQPALAIAEPYLVGYHGGEDSEQRTQSVEAPVPTIPTANHFGLAAPCLIQYNGTDREAHSVDEPLNTVSTRDRFALVAPEYVHLVDKGDVVGWLDIRFRMLQPHELAAAMGFPKDYEFAGNREDKVRQIGNAVPVNLAKALCKAILEGCMQ